MGEQCGYRPSAEWFAEVVVARGEIREVDGALCCSANKLDIHEFVRRLGCDPVRSSTGRLYARCRICEQEQVGPCDPEKHRAYYDALEARAGAGEE